MIAKDEHLSGLSQEPIMAEHDFGIHEALLKTTSSQLQEFSNKTGLSIGSVYRSAWVLHCHTYGGSSLVDFVELDSDFNIISKLSYQLNDHQTLSQICKDLEQLASDKSDIRVHTNGAEVMFGCLEKCLNEPHPRNDGLIWGGRSLIVELSSMKDSVKLKILFDKTVLSKTVAIGYWHTFDRILHCIVQNAFQSLQEADFLSDYDRNQIIAWNTPVPEKPQEQTICSRVEEHVLNRPNAAAVFAWDGTMTYAELDREAFRVALALQAFGVVPGNIVPFCMQKSKWALVAAFAILKVGAALVPTDSTWPKQRMTAILETTAASVIVCSRETYSCFNELAIRPFLLPMDVLSNESPNEVHLPGPSFNDIAFVLFSSGSTGVPKGMIREHGTACIGSIAHAEAMHIDASSRVLQFANHVFDVAMLDFFTTLIMGGCVCIPSEFDRLNNLAAFIQQSQANWVLLTPTVAGMLDPIMVPSLRDVTLGGEAISSELLAKWLPYCRVGINYGSAEVDVTQARDVQDIQDPTNVGKRLPSCICYIVDPNNVKRILPIGAIGELLISAPTMARSYLKQPQRTATSFIPAPVDWYRTNPDGTERSWLARAYRMGDLLQQQWDGSFKFIGRRDFQVKIRGQKVELGEVESHLATHPSVRLCAVMYPRSGPFAERLVAIVEPRNANQRNRGSAAKISLESIKNHLSQRIPSYMVPQICIVTDPMPLTATLKIDRQRLTTWVVEQDVVKASSHSFKSVSTGLKGPALSSNDRTGLKLSRIIADLVTNKGAQQWDTIYGHENSLSQIGLDSVQIMRLSNQISKALNIKVPVETLTDQHMTVKRLAALIDNSSALNDDPLLQGMTTKELRSILTKTTSLLGVGDKNTNCAYLNRENGSVRCSSTRRNNVFLTGATGFLGIRILRALLESERIGTINVLIRGADAARVRSRLAQAAKAANWSIEPHTSNLEIWQGDLSRPHLGLGDSNWSRLTQSSQDESQIDCFIHCGAIVDWTKSYADLEAPNVMSTVQLLNAALELQYPVDFIYISGGQYFQPGINESNDEIDQAFEDAAGSNGYAQTKFVSEQLVGGVGHLVNENTGQSPRCHVVKPAYLIGSARNGIANRDDYLWRVVSAAIRQESYNADEDEQWLLAADVEAVANTIAELAIPVSSSSMQAYRSTKILHGIKVRDFWSIVRDVTNCKLLPVCGQKWLTGVKATMELDPNHVLWPLLDSVEQSSGQLTNQRLLADHMQGIQSISSIESAVRSNVEYLVDVGFLSRTISTSA